jgi:diguanylate cyclase (GGDEF)-like protein
VQAATSVAQTDALTGLLNRRGFTEAVDQELERARRYGHPLALAFIDVRGLKAVNDSQGHLAGDRLLQDVGQLLSDSARTYDVVGRIGGDELAILLPEQSSDGVAAMAERIRTSVPRHRAALGLDSKWDLTIGTSVFPEDGDDFEQLLSAADRRLYEQRGIYIR